MTNSKRQHFELPTWARVAVAIVILLAVLLMMRPKENEFYPESNWLLGPLWMLYVRDFDDKVIGLLVAAVLVPMIVTFPARPRVWTAIVSACGILLWIGFGAWLAMLASA
ncbi:hypothetical protein [Planctomicrobium piriforme]|uniref:Uncharacterized protein n=1 Tax=Planctomicrobium piriforme TaxID=1576369 RepID=A0A1I3KXM4_9PLAN|nr:hypothetical protein [Planctomicrobium piriforme]SFI77078.1 hypothetical protein SAMN05421753_11271 [Planctomicrobium piriforme]